MPGTQEGVAVSTATLFWCARQAEQAGDRMGAAKQLSQIVTPREARGLKSTEHGPDAIGYDVTVLLIHQVLPTQDFRFLSRWAPSE